jgi:small subunit ribosomal protein S18
MAKRQPRAKNKDNARRSKKKVSLLTQEKVEYVDYKDVNLLRRFMSDRAKVRARRVTGNDAQQQREVARAIKSAREMALLPYTNRVTTQRTSKDRDRAGRADAPPPRPTPSTPPPSGGDGADDLEGDEVATEGEELAATEASMVEAPAADVPPADDGGGADSDAVVAAGGES